jgi:hypothetical protein
VPQAMHGNRLAESRPAGGFFDIFLKRAGVHMMPPDRICPRIDGQGLGGENPLPDPLLAGIGILSGKCVG